MAAQPPQVPQNETTATPLCHPERSMSVRKDGHAQSRDPMPADIQQRPDRESSEISALGSPVVPRTAPLGRRDIQLPAAKSRQGRQIIAPSLP